MIARLLKTKQVSATVKSLREAGYEVERTKETVRCDFFGEQIFWALKKGSTNGWICRFHSEVFTFD